MIPRRRPELRAETRFGWILAAVLMVAACQRDPLERTVSAGTPSAFAAWQAHIASDSGADTRRRVDEALREIRFKITGDREIKRSKGESVALAGETVDEAVRKKVHGRPLREVLQLGYELRVRRLTEELVGLEDAMNKNAQLVTRPDDLASKHHLEELRERQRVRVEKYRADIAAAERELDPLVKATGQLLIPLPTDKPDEMPVRR